MNRQQFYHWMNDPRSLDQDSADDLHDIIREYPYFQTARMLNLLNLKLQGDYRFEQEFRRTAAISADRSRLREWLVVLEGGEDKNRPQEKEISAGQHEPNIKKDQHLLELEEQIKASLRELELKKSQLQELLEEKKAIVGDVDSQSEELPLRSLPRDKMLDEFLLEKKEQPDGRRVFYNPEESARKSIEENDEILSETLARLVAAQGKKEKAIKIYQKLMMRYPQKSHTFAAQIEKLRKEL
jgi:hypothetical protein